MIKINNKYLTKSIRTCFYNCAGYMKNISLRKDVINCIPDMISITLNSESTKKRKK